MSQINASAAIFGVPSGPWADGIGGAAEQRNLNDWRPRASISYVTGQHNAKFGYDGGYFAQTRTNRTGNTRLEYRYFTPPTPQGQTTCYNAANPAASTCGNTSLYYPNDPFNQARRPVPDRVTINTGPSTLDNRVSYAGFYAQDQWTLKRFTLSGALRYDHAMSSYPGTCIQGTDNGLTQGNGNEPYVPVQVGGAYAGQKGYCTPDNTDGVSYNDFTPRWGVAWDVFGTGKTSVKWNMGKYLSGAAIAGIYADANPASRTVNRYTRTWTDVDGDRIVDCDLLNFTAQSSARRLRRADLGRRAGQRRGTGATRFSLDETGVSRLVWRRPSADGVKQVFRRRCRPTATSTVTACSKGRASGAPSGSSASAFSTSCCRGSPPRSPTTAGVTRT